MVSFGCSTFAIRKSDSNTSRAVWKMCMDAGDNHRAGQRIAAISDRSPDLISTNRKTISMLWTIAVILIVLWALGLFTHVAGGLIHLLLVVAIIVIVVNLIRGRRMG